VIPGFSHDRKPLQLLLFWSFAHGCSEELRERGLSSGPKSLLLGIETVWKPSLLNDMQVVQL